MQVENTVTNLESTGVVETVLEQKPTPLSNPEEILTIKHANGEVYSARAHEVGKMCTAMAGKTEAEIAQSVADHNAMRDIMQRAKAAKQSAESKKEESAKQNNKPTEKPQQKETPNNDAAASEVVAAHDATSNLIFEAQTAAIQAVECDIIQQAPKLEQLKSEPIKQEKPVITDEIAIRQESPALEQIRAAVYAEQSKPAPEDSVTPEAPPVEMNPLTSQSSEASVEDNPKVIAEVPPQPDNYVYSDPENITNVSPENSDEDVELESVPVLYKATETFAAQLSLDEVEEMSLDSSQDLEAAYELDDMGDAEDISELPPYDISEQNLDIAELTVDMQNQDEEIIMIPVTHGDALQLNDAFEQDETPLSEEMHIVITDFLSQPIEIKQDIPAISELDAKIIPIDEVETITVTLSEKQIAVVTQAIEQLYQTLPIKKDVETLKAFIAFLEFKSIDALLAISEVEPIDIAYLSARLGTQEFIDTVQQSQKKLIAGKRDIYTLLGTLMLSVSTRLHVSNLQTA